MVGSSEDGLRLRLRLSLVLGRTRPLSAEPSPLALAATAETSALEGALVNIVYNIEKGASSSSSSGRHGSSQQHYQTRIICCAWVWGGPGALKQLRPNDGFVPVAATPVEPGTVATAARRMVATSAGGGRPCRRSRPLWRGFLIANTQHKQSVVQSVAVHAVLGGDGPRGSLSTAPSRAVTATAA